MPHWKERVREKGKVGGDNPETVLLSRRPDLEISSGVPLPCIYPYFDIESYLIPSTDMNCEVPVDEPSSLFIHPHSSVPDPLGFVIRYLVSWSLQIQNMEIAFKNILKSE